MTYKTVDKQFVINSLRRLIRRVENDELEHIVTVQKYRGDPGYESWNFGDLTRKEMLDHLLIMSEE